MNKRPFPSSLTALKWGAREIAGIYLLLGAVWILFSDRIAARVALNEEMLAAISTYKGWGYVLVTALLLYWMIRRHTLASQASENQLQRVIDAMPAFIAYVDANLHYRFTNQTYKEMFDDEPVGKHMEEVLGKPAYRIVAKYIDKVLSGETTSYETELPYQDREFFVKATYIPDIGSDGKAKGFFVMAQDRTQQKQVEEAERLWADAFEGCAHGIAIGDPNTNRIVVCNPAFANMHKCRVDDIVGSGILSLYTPSDHEHVRRNFEKADQIGHARFEARMTRRGQDHSTFPVQMDVVSVLGDDGELLHRVTTAQDITDRKQAEKVLQESEERYRLVSDLASDYAYKDRVEEDGSIIPEWFTESFTRITGYTLEEAGAPGFWQQLIYPEDSKVLQEHIQMLLSGQPHVMEMRVITKSGQVCWLRDYSNPIWDADQQRVAALYGAVKDITESKQAEEVLRKSEERYHYLFENNPHPMWIYDRKTLAFLDVNEAAIVKYGYSRQEFLNMTIVDIRPPEDLEKLMDNLAQPRQPLERSEGWRHRLKDGTIIYVEITSHTIVLDGHESALVVAQDITERKQAEENLRRFQLLSEHSRDIILFMGYEDGHILEANAAAVQAYGYSRDELLSLSIRDLRARHTLPLTAAQMAQADAGGILFETIHQRKDGTTFPVEVSSQGATIGDVRALISIVRDITERKNAEQALTESEARFRSLFEHSADAILLLENSLFTDCNQATIRMMHATGKEQLLSLHPSKLSPEYQPDGRSSVEKADEMIRIALNQGSNRFEWIHRRLDGTDFPVEVLLTSISAGDRQVIHTVWRDITERKQIEKALQDAHAELEIKVQQRTAALSEANALLQALMDNIPDHIYFKDLQCRFIRNSRSQATMLGLRDPSEAVGKTDFDFFPHAAQSYADEQEMMRSGKPHVDFEEWVVWPDGRQMWVSTTKMPLRNSEGQTIGIFGISHNITERKRAEQAIRELNADLEKQTQQLQAANKELEAFSYSVSHDLRAPLRAIDGYTRILLEDYEPLLDSEGKRICGVISREALRMGQLIDDLLAFSRLGRKEMYSSQLDMRGLAAAVLNELLTDEDRERMDIHIGKLPAVRGDSSLIRQVWVNLLANAVKFTSKKERAVIEIGSRTTKAEVIYYVRDNGAGFDMEYTNKLFGVFQRLHSEGEFSGTGVGLAIVQRIIRRHNGHVWAEGEVEKGATFYFGLPRKENL
jgi:PAS domain S-box-containing protein